MTKVQGGDYEAMGFSHMHYPKIGKEKRSWPKTLALVGTTTEALLRLKWGQARDISEWGVLEMRFLKRRECNREFKT